MAIFGYACYRLFRRYRPNLGYQCEKMAAYLSGKKSRLSWLWFKTNVRCYRKGAPLHHASAWKYMTEDQWLLFVKQSIALMDPPVTLHSRMFEVGVGVGAFSKTVSDLTGCSDISGIDPVPEAIAMAQKVLPNGRFKVGNGIDLSSFESNSYDHVFAIGVIMYLDNLDEARKFVAEMIRIAKPGASILINCISEPGGRNIGSGNICISKSWWNSACQGCLISAIKNMDEWPGQHDRYSVYLRKSM